MNKPANWTDSGLRWSWIALLSIVVDQLTKYWISTNLAITTHEVRGDAIHVLPVLDIIYTTNTGAAYSFGAGTVWGRWLFTALAIVVSVALIYWLRRLSLAAHKLLSLGLVLIFSGAVGNVIDRLRFGHVIDFVDAHWKLAHFPAFNVADAAITVGATCVILDAIMEHRREKRAALSKGK
jgi:signal peptidase II